MTASTGGSPQAPPARRRLAADVLRFNRDGISVRNAARMAVGTTLALLVGYLAGSWTSGAAAAGGALAVGISSVVPAPRPRVGVLTATAIGMTVSTFLGSATSAYPVPHVVVGAAIAFGGGLLMGVEPPLGGVAINTLIGFLVYGRFAEAPLIALRTAGFVLAGGCFQVLLISFARERPHVGRALSGLSRAYSALADITRELRVETSSLPAAKALDAAYTDIEFSLTAGRASEAWSNLAGEAARIRLEFLSLASARSAAERLSSTSDGDKAAFRHLRSAVTEFLRCVAQSLASASIPSATQESLARVEAAVGDLVERSLRRDGHHRREAPFVRAATAAQALAGQLRAVAGLLDDAVSVRRPRPHGADAVRSAQRISRRGVRTVEAVVQEMRANLTLRSDATRHALRLTVVVTVATAVAHAANLGRGYWLAMTAAIVLRPDFSATFTRGVGRALGTLVGVGIATAFTLGLHPTGAALVALTGCFVLLAGALFNASYMVFSIAVTGVVVFLLAGIDSGIGSGIGQSESATAIDRLVETVLGAAFALVAYLVWPAWGRRPASDAIAELAEATHRYVVAVLRSYLHEQSNQAQLGALSRAARLARTNAESAIDRSLADPDPMRIDTRLTTGLLAGSRRLSIAAHTLRLRRPADVEAAGRAYREFVDAVDRELGDIAARVRFGRVVKQHEPLRELQRAVAAALASRESQTAALLSSETDEIVDATNSLVALLDRARAPVPVSR